MVEKFLTYLSHEKNSSPRTILKYGEDLRAFERFFKQLDSQLTWETVDADVIRDWTGQMMDQGQAATSVNRRLSALRSFFRFALSRKLVEKDPAHHLKGPKVSRPLPKFIREKDMDRLLDGGEEMWDDSFNSVRARTIIMTFYATGIRLSELVGLNDHDVDFQQKQLKVLGKRDKERIIPFGAELEKALVDYLALRDQTIELHDGSLFVNDKGRRISAEAVTRVVKDNLAKVTTQQKRSPHVLRHSFATAMLNNDAGLESVKKLLGHESLETTQIYTHTTFEQLKRIYKQAHPRA